MKLEMLEIAEYDLGWEFCRYLIAAGEVEAEIEIMSGGSNYVKVTVQGVVHQIPWEPKP